MEDLEFSSVGGKNMMSSDILHLYAYKCNSTACALGVPVVFSDPLTPQQLTHNRASNFVKSFMKSHPQSLDSVDAWVVPINIRDNHWVLCVFDLHNHNLFVLDSLLTDCNNVEANIIVEVENEDTVPTKMFYNYVLRTKNDHVLLNEDDPRIPFNLEDISKFMLLCLVHAAYPIVTKRPNQKHRISAPTSSDDADEKDETYALMTRPYTCRQKWLDCGIFAICAMEKIARCGIYAVHHLIKPKSRFEVKYGHDILARRKSIGRELFMVDNRFIHNEAWGIGVPHLDIASICSVLFTRWFWNSPTKDSIRLRIYLESSVFGSEPEQNAAHHVCVNALSNIRYGSTQLKLTKDGALSYIVIQKEIATQKIPKEIPHFAVNFVFEKDLWGGFVEVFYCKQTNADFNNIKESASDLLLERIKTTDKYGFTLQCLYASKDHTSRYFPIHPYTSSTKNLLAFHQENEE